MRDECPLSEVRAPSQHPPSRTSESHGLLTNLLILVPLYRSEVPDRICRLWSRDFRSAVLASAFNLEFFDELCYSSFRVTWRLAAGTPFSDNCVESARARRQPVFGPALSCAPSDSRADRQARALDQRPCTARSDACFSTCARHAVAGPREAKHARHRAARR